MPENKRLLWGNGCENDRFSEVLPKNHISVIRLSISVSFDRMEKQDIGYWLYNGSG